MPPKRSPGEKQSAKKKRRIKSKSDASGKNVETITEDNSENTTPAFSQIDFGSGNRTRNMAYTPITCSNLFLPRIIWP